MSAPVGEVIQAICGSIFIGTVLTTAFYGVSCMQTSFYYAHYPKDPLFIKGLVAIIWSLNTIQEALTLAGAYKHSIAVLENSSSVGHGTKDLIILVMNVCAVLTQGFLIYRIYNFSGKNIAAPLIWVSLGIVQIVTVLIYLAKSLYTSNGVVHAVDVSVLGETQLVDLSTIGLAVAAGEDVLIAISMTILLLRERRDNNIASTGHILQRLTVLTVNTGVWSATFAVLSVIFMHTFSFPWTITYAVVRVPLCPIYCNTLLANLNARVYIRGHLNKSDYFTRSTMLPMSDLSSMSKQYGGAESVISHQETEPAMFSDGNHSQSQQL